MLKKGEAAFFIRYTDRYEDNLIECHKKIERHYGYCWYGKIGRSPSVKRLEELIHGGNAKVFFYKKGSLYIADLLDISTEMPQDGYADFYNSLIRLPSLWMKICHIKRANEGVLSMLKISASGNVMSDVINKSMTSFYFVEMMADI